MNKWEAFIQNIRSDFIRKIMIKRNEESENPNEEDSSIFVSDSNQSERYMVNVMSILENS